MTTSTLRLPPRIARLPQLRQIVRGGLAARGSIGAGLAAKAGGAAAAPWYLAGGAPAPAAVWQPKGAASLAASYLRIAGGAGYANIDPAVVGGVAMTFDAELGWINDTTRWLKTGIPANLKPVTILVRVICASGDWWRYIVGASGAGGLCINTIPTSVRFEATSVGITGIGTTASGMSLNVSHTIAFVYDIDSAWTLYLDGAPNAAGVKSATLLTDTTFQINCRYTGDTTSIWSGSTQALAIWDTSTNHAAWMPVVMGACALI